jgi:hypothetical protein
MRNVVSVALGLVLMGSVATAADYDLYLYDAGGWLLDSSIMAGTAMDVVYDYALSGDDGTAWEVRVVHYSGDADAGYTVKIYADGSLLATYVATYAQSFYVTVYSGELIEAELFSNEDSSLFSNEDSSSSSDCGATGTGLPGALALLIPLAGAFVAMRRRLGLVSA